MTTLISGSTGTARKTFSCTRSPDQIVYADAETKGSNGAPLLLVKDDEVYLTLGLIANYTDVQIQTFDSGEGRRVLINDWGTRNIARVKKAGSLRVKGGVKSKILTDLAKDDTVSRSRYDGEMVPGRIFRRKYRICGK